MLTSTRSGKPSQVGESVSWDTTDTSVLTIRHLRVATYDWRPPRSFLSPVTLLFKLEPLRVLLQVAGLLTLAQVRFSGAVSKGAVNLTTRVSLDYRQFLAVYSPFPILPPLSWEKFEVRGLPFPLCTLLSVSDSDSGVITLLRSSGLVLCARDQSRASMCTLCPCQAFA